MAPKLWRESYSAKGMHALIEYHRSDIHTTIKCRAPVATVYTLSVLY